MKTKNALPWADYSSWMSRHFPFKVQKISLDAGFSCPNRDGTISRGGCTFCDNQTFNPSYCNPKRSVTEQLEEGKAFFARKYPEMRYLAYFQAFSNTYAPLSRLRQLYKEALAVKDVVGLVIGTRPDCVSDELLVYLHELSQRTFVVVEYGVESVYDQTLLRINRGHTFRQTCEAISKTHEAGLLCGAHVILGLPGESRDMIVRSAEVISSLPLDFLKIHQLQIIRGTRMAQEWQHQQQLLAIGTAIPEEELIRVFTLDDYLDLLVDYLGHLRSDLVIERFVSQSPADMLLAPRWGLKNHEFVHKLQQRLTVR